MVQELTEVWEKSAPFGLAMAFESYMKSIGARKYDNRRKDNSNTYMIDGKTTNWNKVECYYYKDSTKYGEQNLSLVLRKKSGDYFIIQKKDRRAFEIDDSGLRSMDENLLQAVMEEHKPLFEILKKAVG